LTGNKYVTATEPFAFKLDKNAVNLAVAKGIWESVQAFDKEFIPDLISGMENAYNIYKKAERGAHLPSYHREFIEAKNNLEYASNLFNSLANKQDVNCLIPQQLYYKTIRGSQNKVECKGPLVSLEFSIFSPLGHCLAYERKVLVNLKNTIPGFAMGIQGMKVGETREIFIHPSLAYGYETSIDKCSALRAIVTLLTIQDNTPYIPSFNPLDLSFVLDEHALVERVANYKLALLEKGKMIADHLKQCPQIDLSLICAHLKKFQKDSNEYVPSTAEERTLINQVHWNIYFAEGFCKK
jgi:hypothetical protein